MLCPVFHVSDRKAEWHRNTAFRRKAEQGWSLLMQRAPLLAHSLSVHLTMAPCFEGRGESLAPWGKDNSDDWGGGQSYPTMPAISSALAPGQRERKMLSLSSFTPREDTFPGASRRSCTRLCLTPIIKGKTYHSTQRDYICSLLCVFLKHRRPLSIAQWSWESTVNPQLPCSLTVLCHLSHLVALPCLGC